MNKLALCLMVGLTSQLLPAATGYLVHNLVADAASTVTPPADNIDPRLVNAWGLVASATSPFWVCDAGTGLSTVYTVNATNTTALGLPNPTTQPTVPGAGGVPKGVCTGIVANTAPATTPVTFPVTAPGKAAVAASFIFVTEDGVLSAWANGADATQAFVEADNSKTAVYKGLALVTTPVVQLYLANFKAGTIDVYDAQFKPVTLAAGAFADTKIPAGFAPFNIWNLGGKLYVAYAKQDANQKFDVAGAGNGYVDVFDTTGKLLQSLVVGGTGSLLNSPWGLAIAPATFGKFANDLLVGNFGDGTINAYDPTTGAFAGTLQDASGKNIVIPGLWALTFGNGSSGGDKDTLYFAAGPGGSKHGLLGSISANPNVVSTAITNAAQVAGGIAANTYVTIKGTNLAATKRSWVAADFGTTGKALPTALDGVSVTINGEPAYISYISPVQINLLTPTDLPSSGQVTVVVTDNTLTSTTVNVSPQAVAPSFFLLDAAGHIAATHANNSLIGTTAPATPAAPGETIVLYGNGFGPTNPSALTGQAVTSAAPMLVTPTVTFNGNNANVVFAGLTGTGLYQFNVVVPSGLADGDAAVVAKAAGVSSPSGALITIKN
uniref:IPT/TIG domain-containing protein n=1 Tax=Solibacter usitatus (strain Ellin6076) TaxID=234267 RepID=Q01S76_SOLUE